MAPRILVCGGRNYADERKLWATLDAICAKRGWGFPPDTSGANYLANVVVISGKAPGADSLAIDWGVANFCTVEEYPADWTDLSQPGAVIRTRRDGTRYDVLAGHRRNQSMLDEGKPDLVVAFPGGTGTADMVRRALKAGVEVIEVK